MAKRMTKDMKVKVIGGSTELTTAVRLLVALFLDLKLKNYIKYTYTIDDKDYILELRLKETQNEDTQV